MANLINEKDNKNIIKLLLYADRINFEENFKELSSLYDDIINFQTYQKIKALFTLIPKRL